MKKTGGWFANILKKGSWKVITSTTSCWHLFVCLQHYPKLLNC